MGCRGRTDEGSSANRIYTPCHQLAITTADGVPEPPPAICSESRRRGMALGAAATERVVDGKGVGKSSRPSPARHPAQWVPWVPCCREVLPRAPRRVSHPSELRTEPGKTKGEESPRYPSSLRCKWHGRLAGQPSLQKSASLLGWARHGTAWHGTARHGTALL